MPFPHTSSRPPSPQAARSAWIGFGQAMDSPAEQFASWLPYSAYLAAEKLFVNRDSVGFMLEVMPQSGADERMAEVLISLYSTCPPGTGIQFHLFASPHVREQLRRYANLRVEDTDQADKAKHWGRPARNDNLFHRLARQRVGHLLQGAQQSLTAGFHYTIRDFRLMMSVAVTADAEDLTRRDALMALRESMSSTLRSASLPNRVCDAADLINWCALFTNPRPGLADRRSQPALRRRPGDPRPDHRLRHHPGPAPGRPAAVEGERRGTFSRRFYSIKSLSERFAPVADRLADRRPDAAGAPVAPGFLLTMGVHVLDPERHESVVTANRAARRRPTGQDRRSVMPTTARKLQDWTAAANAIDIGSSLVSLYHQLAIFSTPGKSVAARRPPTPSGAAGVSSSTPTSTSTGRR